MCAENKQSETCMGPVLTKAFSKSVQSGEDEEDHNEDEDDDDDDDEEEEQSAPLLKITEYLSTQKKKPQANIISSYIIYLYI